jgi:glycosyltransferase involved in cell wall biosynthesis
MSKVLTISVWAVFPSANHWRGEGIAQTIENILLHSSEDVKYQLIISDAHLSAAKEALGHKKNIKFYPLGFHAGRKVFFESSSELIPKLTTFQLIDWSFFRNISLFLSLCSGQFFRFFSFLSIRRIMLRGDIIFCPSPLSSPRKFFLKNKKFVFNFWDPFVFEYTAFGISRNFLLCIFLKKMSLVGDGIITQSKANRDYLIDVLGIKPENIYIIPNGSPSYKELYNRFPEDKKKALEGDSRRRNAAFWPEKSLQGRTKSEISKLFIADTLNKSIVFRLCSNIEDNSKIIFVSTQFRPYKGFELLFDLFDTLLKSAPEFNFHFVFTTKIPVDFLRKHSSHYPWISLRVYEITRVSNLQHAFLYKMSDLVLHPSLVEGGSTLYPGSEAASLGIPSLINTGRHTREMIADHGAEAAEVVMNLSQQDTTIKRIISLLTDKAMIEHNLRIIEKLNVNWVDSSQSYSDVFRKISGVVSAS